MKRLFFLLTAAGMGFTACNSPEKSAKMANAIPKDSVVAIAKAAFVYGVPLALIDITRKKLTNYEVPQDGTGAPSNQFAISTKFPDAKFRDVVRPNADTYYSSASLDLSKEPLVMTVPNTGTRYYLLPMLDAYTNVFQSPGKRTGVTTGGNYLITGPKWSGTVPDNMKQIKSPTDMVWMIGRFEVLNAADGAKIVVPLEKKLALTPLSAFGKPYTAPKGTPDASLSKADPNDQVIGMPIGDFFNYINNLMVLNPPSKADQAALSQFERIGVSPGGKFDLSSFDTATQSALSEIPKMVAAEIQAAVSKGIVKPVNGWSVAYKGFGNYGTDYDLRAAVAILGLGANIPEDAVYPTSTVDADGTPYDGANKYVMHFEKDKTPPIKGFWSITMYDKDGYFIENPINRYAIGDRNNLKKNADGSIDLYIQNSSPGKDKESNWLPAPPGSFNLCLRMYWPAEVFLKGEWTPPGVVKQK
ncbi:MAG: DUF1254 domain-containing protein [Chitinophagales bacterium]